MEFYTGIDILHIPRMAKAIENHRFICRVFGEKEREYYLENGKKVSFLAGNFAAKEAFSKALQTGVRGFCLSEVEVLRNSLGAPYFYFSGNAQKIVNTRQLHTQVSISHEKEYAVASVLVWASPIPAL